MVERRAHKAPHEARVVVVEVSVRVLEAAIGFVERDDGLFLRDGCRGQHARALGEEVAHHPVEPGPREQLPQPMAKAFRSDCEEPDLLDRGGVRGDEGVSRTAELADQTELERFEVFDSAPREVRRFLTRRRGEVPAVDERDLCAAGGEGCRTHRTVDAATKDEHVERASVEFMQVGLA